MSLFYLPRQREFADNGTVLSGARLYFYTAGTLTPELVYQDAALTVPHTQPVVANSAGVWPQIFLDASRLYKVDLRRSDNSSVSGYPVDNVSTGDLAVTAAAQAAVVAAEQAAASANAAAALATQDVAGFVNVHKTSVTLPALVDSAVQTLTGYSQPAVLPDGVLAWNSTLGAIVMNGDWWCEVYLRAVVEYQFVGGHSWWIAPYNGDGARLGPGTPATSLFGASNSNLSGSRDYVATFETRTAARLTGPLSGEGAVIARIESVGTGTINAVLRELTLQVRTLYRAS